ncbi:ATP-binding protein [Sphingobium yanoikuyae]|uniref:hybrid sensor histidine kinase/response regulator n=1 Tax=Sphingobium yanoikuyae TaxID=13690 RepID=UPI001BE6A31A|nr:ATP-binding protein [Sphingobium yanoikuyae]MBT2246102.1 PAS domain-containing protein [Sphingobium sp. BHU LFT2]WBQ19044.1 ATP-binding protein [Sphingobium yanoikuyae]
MANDAPLTKSDQLRAVLAAAGASGSWDWDIASDSLTVDSRFAELYGLGDDAAGKPLPTSVFFKAIHPEDRARIRIAVAGLLAGAELFSKEFRIVTPGGAVLWMQGRGQSHLDANDEPVRFTGLLVDITERKRTEERLRIAQSAGGVGTFEYQDGFSTVSVSSEFCRLLGLHPTNRLPVRTINSVLCEGDMALIPEGDAADLPLNLDGEFCIYPADGSQKRWVARRGEVLREANGKGFRLLGVIYDISVAKGLETELRSLNDTLEQRVASEIEDRLRTEEALRQSQKMEAVGQLTGGIAHDFNNLLTIIIGSVDAAARRLDAGADSRVRRSLDHAMKGAERAAALTQRLLAFSRQQPLSPRAVDVPRLISGMSDLLTRTISESIAIAIEAPDDVWTVEADPNQLENAILNLAVNARDAMPEGGDLTISASNHVLVAGQGDLPAGDYVAIAVRDSGIGMDAETLAKVFDPFFTTKEVGKGTGLGLSMVYGFAHQSGGAVDIRSRLGQGTTVTILLARSDGTGTVKEVEAEREATEYGLPSETILVVEDDDDVRAYTVGSLRELGYRVVEAHDGASALALLDRQGEKLRLLLTDVVMPQMSGSDLAAAVRRVKPALPILYTSGYTREAILKDGRLEPGVDLLTKPFTLKSLAAKVRELLDRH